MQIKSSFDLEGNSCLFMGCYVLHNSLVKTAVSTKGMQKLESQVVGPVWAWVKH